MLYTDTKCKGGTLVEYLAALIGIIALWQAVGLIIRLFNEHYDEFMWTLTHSF